jgi:hypothetical protein
MTLKSIDLKSLAELMARTAALKNAVTGSATDPDFKSAITTTALGLFRVVVMGEIKKGKSSFINALLGLPGLVPVHSDVATSTVFKIRYGTETRYTVFFHEKDQQGQQLKREIKAEEIHAYGTESGNPDNEKQIDFIAIEAPGQLLKDGLILVDTPGVGGLFKKHRDITYRHAPKADAIFFITDSVESPIGADEVSFLRELRRTTGLVYFVQTKAASVDSEARKKRMGNNISILEKEVGIPAPEIAYFAVDSKLKSEGDLSRDLDDLKDSGYPELTSFIQRKLKPSKDRNIASLAIRRSRTQLEIIRSELAQQQRILDSDNDEKIKALDEEIQAIGSKIKEWESTKAVSLIQEFGQEMNTINLDVQTQLRLAIQPGGLISEFCNSSLLKASVDVSSNEIYACAPHILEDVRAKCSEALLVSSGTLQDKSQKLLESLALKAGLQLDNELSIQLVGKPLGGYVESSLRDMIEKSQDQKVFETMRTGLMGGGAGVAIASIAGGVLGSVIPVVGTVIGSTIGVMIAGAWGGKLACDIKSDKDKEMARREVMSVIDKELTNILAEATAELNKATFTLRGKAEEAMRMIIAQAKERLASQRSTLQKRRNADHKTLTDARLKYDRQLKELEQITTQLDHREKEIV